VTVTSQQWIVPGRPVTGGDGWTVELPGLAVRVEGPTPHARLSKGASTVDVRAHVAPLCGCPIDAGGTWDAAAYVVEAVVRRDGKEVSRTPLPFAGATGEFGGPVTLPGAGTYELIVYAWDGRGGSTGLDRTTVVAP